MQLNADILKKSITARKENNEFGAMLNVASKDKKTRLYPELEHHDKIKILREQTITERDQPSHSLKVNTQSKQLRKKLEQTCYN